MNTSNSLVIETHNLSKVYKGVEALKDLNLMVNQHSLFGFQGPNGAGKTTTVCLLNGVIDPTSGSMRVLGLDPQVDGSKLRLRTGVLIRFGSRSFHRNRVLACLSFHWNLVVKAALLMLADRRRIILPIIGQSLLP